MVEYISTMSLVAGVILITAGVLLLIGYTITYTYRLYLNTKEVTYPVKGIIHPLDAINQEHLAFNTGDVTVDLINARCCDEIDMSEDWTTQVITMNDSDKKELGNLILSFMKRKAIVMYWVKQH